MFQIANRKSKACRPNGSRHSLNLTCSSFLWACNFSSVQKSMLQRLYSCLQPTISYKWVRLGWMKHTSVNIECTYSVNILSMRCCLKFGLFISKWSFSWVCDTETEKGMFFKLASFLPSHFHFHNEASHINTRSYIVQLPTSGHPVHSPIIMLHYCSPWLSPAS